MYSERYQQHIKTLVEKIEQADAIVVGGASGMSAAGGYNWYEDNAAFREHFVDFAIKYGIDSIFGGFYYRFQTIIKPTKNTIYTIFNSKISEMFSKSSIVFIPIITTCSRHSGDFA